MKTLFVFAITAIINSFGIIYSTQQFLKSGQKFFNRKTIFVFVLITVALALQFAFIESGVRTIIISIFMISVFSLMFKEEKKTKIILSYFFALLLYVFADIFVYLFLVKLMGMDIKMLTDISGGMLLSSVFSTGFVMLVSSYRRINKYLVNLVRELEADTIMAIIFSFIILVIVIIYMWIPYIKATNRRIEILPFLIIITTYMLGSFYIIIQKQIASKKTTENKNLIINLEKNEEIINQQFKLNHDNKNDLITIKGMVENKDKNLNEFLDELIKEKLESNSNKLNKAAQIPSGGLRGIIYLKALDAEKKNIEMSITSSKNVYQYDASRDPKTNRDLCKIIGIFLDNAIEATENIENKFISINLNIYNGELVITISNSYFGTIDLSKIDQTNYSSKGKKRGYGLANVKDIIEHNSNLYNQRKIDGSTFTQLLKVIL